MPCLVRLCVHLEYCFTGLLEADKNACSLFMLSVFVILYSTIFSLCIRILHLAIIPDTCYISIKYWSYSSGQCCSKGNQGYITKLWRFLWKDCSSEVVHSLLQARWLLFNFWNFHLRLERIPVRNPGERLFINIDSVLWFTEQTSFKIYSWSFSVDYVTGNPGLRIGNRNSCLYGSFLKTDSCWI